VNYESGAILVLSGPSGAGKSTLLKKIIDDIGSCYFSISTTTRPIREGEVDGVDYHFVSLKEFQEDIENDMFLEYANVHGNYYGTSMKAVKKALQAGKLVIFDIDVQGNAVVTNRLGDITTSVYITTNTFNLKSDCMQDKQTHKRLLMDVLPWQDVRYKEFANMIF
jgi:guanylate kinase